MKDQILQQSMASSAAHRDSLVLVKMLAAPINPADINQIQGTYPLQGSGDWHVGGNEGVGRVISVGPGVRSLAPGDLVIPAKACLGTWREQLIALEGDLYKIPSDLPLEVAATLLVNPPTAYRMLHDFVPLQAGRDVVVQNGANSAVGRAVIAMAKKLNICTINIIRDRPDYESVERELRELGASYVVRADKFATSETQSYLKSLLKEQQRISLGLNCIGGLATIDMANFMSEGGTIVTYGGMSRKNPLVSTASLIFKDLRYVGYWMSRWYATALQDPAIAVQRDHMLGEIIEMFRKGTLATPPMHHINFGTGWVEALNYYQFGEAHPSGGKQGQMSKPMFIFE
jgi:trans-2-enoyl-CoA reductase